MKEEKIPVILLMNGPNLDMLGKRSRRHYGDFTLEQVEIAFGAKASSLGVDCAFFQSNEEGALVSEIHRAMSYADGIVINAGAYTHYSYAILDALELCGLPVMEVHISNIHKREPFRRISVIRDGCVGQVYGLGMDSYLVGLEKLVREHIEPKSKNCPAILTDLEIPPPDLAALRTQLTQIDGELMEIFNRRMSVSEEVGRNKLRAMTSPVYDARREEEVVDLARQRADESRRGQVDGWMKTVLRTSRECQYAILMEKDMEWEIGKQVAAASDSMTVEMAAFGGSSGSYSEMAAQKLFPGAEGQAFSTFAEACEQVKSEKNCVAVLPLENTTAGTVDDVYAILQRSGLFIIAATSVRIRHRLAVIPGTKLSDIRKVTSHPQGLAQCSEMIRDEKWEAVPSGNTAFAAEQVARTRDKALAAIASEEAALQNGLETLPVEISNSSFNHTRFIALGNRPVIPQKANRISIVMHLPHRSGALAGALEVFSDYGLNLCSIFSRPIQDTPWEYAFFLDFLCDAGDPNALLSLYQLSAEMPLVKWLGWYEDIG